MLGGVFVFLLERVGGLPGCCVGLFGGFVEVCRPRSRFVVRVVGDSVCSVVVFGVGFSGEVGWFEVDLCVPGSLQLLFEFVMSRRWR